MSSMVDKLHAAREVAWGRLAPAFDHAISLAKEADFLADKASMECQTAIAPVYPVLVELLGESMP
jgi:hypothetical protein